MYKKFEVNIAKINAAMEKAIKSQENPSENNTNKSQFFSCQPNIGNEGQDNQEAEVEKGIIIYPSHIII